MAILFKRGAVASIPTLAVGEPGWTTDTNELFVGSAGGNVKVTAPTVVVPPIFSKVAVAGQATVEADSTADTLTLAAGSGITITTNASTDTVTIAAAGGGPSPAYGSVRIAGITNPTYSLSIFSTGSTTANRSLTLSLGDANRTLHMTGDLAVGPAASVAGPNTGDQPCFASIAVAGQTTVEADSTADTLTLAAGSGITLTTDAATDTVTIAATAAPIADGSVTTAKLADDAVTYPKMQHVTGNRLLGRTDVAGEVEEIPCYAVTRNLLAAVSAGDFINAIVPVGVVWECDEQPPGTWLEENGQAVSRSTYFSLWLKLGTRHGAGNGTTTFNVRDRRGRATIGAGTGTGLTARSLGQAGGAETHTLSGTENGTHLHPPSAGYEGYWQRDVNNALGFTQITGTGGAFDSTPNNTGYSGSGAPHNNMQPWTVSRYWIKA